MAAGKDGRAAVLEVVMDALASPPPPSTQARAGKCSCTFGCDVSAKLRAVNDTVLVVADRLPLSWPP